MSTDLLSQTPEEQSSESFASAALLSAAIGSFMFGLAIMLVERNAAIKTALTWSDPVGPLSGKAGVGILSWLAVWGVLHLLWSKSDMPLRRVLLAVWILLALAALMVFPPVFQFGVGE